jgi:hypothetical protein
MMFKRIALTLCLACVFCSNGKELGAATETVTISIDDTHAKQLDELIDAWLQVQKNADQTPRYPQATPEERKEALLKFILKFDYIQIMLKACGEFPEKCPQGIKDSKASRDTANEKYQTLLNDLVK